MLKKKEYKKGSLYSRIDKAAEDHLITEEMAKWAHEVRLDSNEPRHDADLQAHTLIFLPGWGGDRGIGLGKSAWVGRNLHPACGARLVAVPTR